MIIYLSTTNYIVKIYYIIIYFTYINHIPWYIPCSCAYAEHLTQYRPIAGEVAGYMNIYLSTTNYIVNIYYIIIVFYLHKQQL